MAVADPFPVGFIQEPGDCKGFISCKGRLETAELAGGYTATNLIPSTMYSIGRTAALEWVPFGEAAMGTVGSAWVGLDNVAVVRPAMEVTP